VSYQIRSVWSLQSTCSIEQLLDLDKHLTEKTCTYQRVQNATSHPLSQAKYQRDQNVTPHTISKTRNKNRILHADGTEDAGNGLYLVMCIFKSLSIYVQNRHCQGEFRRPNRWSGVENNQEENWLKRWLWWYEDGNHVMVVPEFEMPKQPARRIDS
jgi:hypothetical protein